MDNKKNFIVCKNVFKSFSKDIVPVNNISFEFERSTFYAIKGRSGAGKSTFLQILGLIDTADKGKIIIDGEDISKLDDDGLAEYRKSKIGFIFQSCFLNPRFTALENVMLPMLLDKDIKEAENAACELLEKVGVYERRDHFPKKLSGGEQQRVAVARAFANNPDCIIADEPTGNLDEENEEAILSMLKESCLLYNKCVICVSHSEKIEQYADKLIHYKKGEIVL